jgi:hypothetical protein
MNTSAAKVWEPTASETNTRERERGRDRKRKRPVYKVASEDKQFVRHNDDTLK